MQVCLWKKKTYNLILLYHRWFSYDQFYVLSNKQTLCFLIFYPNIFLQNAFYSPFPQCCKDIMDLLYCAMIIFSACKFGFFYICFTFSQLKDDSDQISPFLHLKEVLPHMMWSNQFQSSLSCEKWTKWN